MAPITIRELDASDRRKLVFTFGHLSERSRYQRYLSAKPFLGARDIRVLIDVDHWHHDALIALSPPPRTPIGIARYVRLDEFDTAEFAIEVVDGWQRRGVGIALLEALRERAIRAGIHHFSVSMLRDNRGARALAAHIGPIEAAAAAGSLIELRYGLAYSPCGASPDPAGSSDPDGSSPLSPPPSAPTPTGVG